MAGGMKISMMNIGDKAVVMGYENRPGPYRERVLSMGLAKGAEFTLIKKAPLGDPVEIEILGYKLSLRKEEADVIIIEKMQMEAGI